MDRMWKYAHTFSHYPDLNFSVRLPEYEAGILPTRANWQY